jgi:hypothetical protein
VQVPQPGPGLDAELGDQHIAGALVGGQRLALPPAPVQGQHQLPVQALAQRMAGGQLPQLGNQLLVMAPAQLTLDPPVQRLHMQLFQVRQPLIAQQLGGHVRQRRAAPQSQRLRRGPRRLRPPARASRRARVPGQRLEPGRIQLIAPDRDHITGGTGHDPRRDPLIKLPPQPHHEGAGGFNGPSGRRAIPDQLGELIGRHRLVRPPQQHREQRPQPGRRDHTRLLGIPGHHLQRPQHPELHAVSLIPTPVPKAGMTNVITRLSRGCHASMRASRCEQIPPPHIGAGTLHMRKECIVRQQSLPWRLRWEHSSNWGDPANPSRRR